MTSPARPIEETLVSCDVCLKQVPLSEATVPEAADYFVHFCGLECYAQWQKRREADQEQKTRPAGSAPE